MSNRTFESNLITPAVLALATVYSKTGDRNIKSDDFRSTLRNMLSTTLSEEDNAMNTSRKEYSNGKTDKRIDQIIRNLISHRKLDKMGFTEYNPMTRTMKFKIKGMRMAEQILSELTTTNTEVEVAA